MPKAPAKPRVKTLKVCPLCQTEEQSWYVKKYYVSLDSVLFMCENTECLYPFHDEAHFETSLKKLKAPVYVDDSITSSTSSTTTTTAKTKTKSKTKTTGAAELTRDEKETTKTTDSTPGESTEEDEESTEDGEESTEAAQPTPAESSKAAVHTPLESSSAHPLPTPITQSSSLDTMSTTQSLLELTWPASSQDSTTAMSPTLLPEPLCPPLVWTPGDAPPHIMSASSDRPNTPAAAPTPKRKRSGSEDEDADDDLAVEGPSHKRRSRSLERAFAVTPPPPALGWSVSPSTSPPFSAESTFGYISDDSWTHPATPADSKGFSGIDMGNLYVPPSNTIETGPEDDLQKMLFGDMPMTEMADLQAFSSELGFGQLDQGDDLDELLLRQMHAERL
ncbi:hypothetical protein KVV02_003229 [Mortierella alpina]|uniref:Uncharacterized protein n=1 Tax=Mortierella alpina TaxID=64518 RepID=A0A9P8A433_MORAP|nr:hypothetical protein KVV02_003229 [Mortierella alpina]